MDEGSYTSRKLSKGRLVEGEWPASRGWLVYSIRTLRMAESWREGRH